MFTIEINGFICYTLLNRTFGMIRGIHMNKRRFESEQTKERIAAQAKELFVQKGYAATSIDDLCKATGSSKGSIYYHFKSKDHLFLYLVEQGILEWAADWKLSAANYQTCSDKLYGHFTHFIKHFQTYPLLKAQHEFMAAQEADPEIIKRISEVSNLVYETIDELLEEGMQKGEFKKEKTRDLTLILVSILNGISSYFGIMADSDLNSLYQKGISVFLTGVKR